MKLDTTALTPGRTAHTGLAHRLLILDGPENAQVGRSVVLSPASPIEIGRGTPSLPLPDAQLSRAHARIERVGDDAGGFLLRDLESRNGTFVNGRRIEEHRLQTEDVIRMGGHLFLYQALTLEACEMMAAANTEDPLIVGASWRILELRTAIERAGPGDWPVLILGETGVGKELVASMLHELNGRAGPLVPVNCAALPEQLAESELFGHAKGAFTGAAQPSPGLFGAADGGTLFLDEIGEISLGLQAKLLRALATGEIRRVGETQTRHVNARVVAATNVDLAEAVDAGEFRADLYARLLGAVISVPPLRARREDILVLTRHFLGRADADVRVDIDAAEALAIHAWPFNVRELEQIIVAAAPRARVAGRLELDHLPPPLPLPIEERATGHGPAQAHGRVASADADALIALRVRRDGVPTRAELETVLRHFTGNIAQVAAYFSRDRKQIYRWAGRLGVDLDAHRRGDAEPD